MISILSRNVAPPHQSVESVNSIIQLHGRIASALHKRNTSKTSLSQTLRSDATHLIGDELFSPRSHHHMFTNLEQTRQTSLSTPYHLPLSLPSPAQPSPPTSLLSSHLLSTALAIPTASSGALCPSTAPPRSLAPHIGCPSDLHTHRPSTLTNTPDCCATSCKKSFTKSIHLRAKTSPCHILAKHFWVAPFVK